MARNFFSWGLMESFKSKVRHCASTSAVRPPRRLHSKKPPADAKMEHLAQVIQQAQGEMEALWQSECSAFKTLIKEVESLNIPARQIEPDVLHYLGKKLEDRTGEALDTVMILKDVLCKDSNSVESFCDFVKRTFADKDGKFHEVLAAILSINRRDVVTHILRDDSPQGVRAFIKRWKEAPRQLALEPTYPHLPLPASNRNDVSTIPSNTSIGLTELISGLDEGRYLTTNVESQNPEITDNNIVTVFITHTDKDWVLALWLAYILRSHYKFYVCLQKDLEHLWSIRHEDIIHTVIEKMDFIIPVVTEDYIQEIKPSDDPTQMDNSELTVSRIFRELQAWMTNHQCQNYRIRPVYHGLSSGVVRRSGQELRWSLKLWKEVPKLADMLRKTKTNFMNHPVAEFKRVENGIRSLSYLHDNFRRSPVPRDHQQVDSTHSFKSSMECKTIFV